MGGKLTDPPSDPDRKKHPGGRPSIYTDELATDICARIAYGESVRTIVKSEGMPEERTVYRWLAEKEQFCQQYMRAKEITAEVYAEECVEIADNSSSDTYIDDNGTEKTDHEVVARSRLRVDTRKWYASKVAPKKYGERIAQDVNSKNENVNTNVNLNVDVGSLSDEELESIVGILNKITPKIE